MGFADAKVGQRGFSGDETDGTCASVLECRCDSVAVLAPLPLAHTERLPTHPTSPLHSNASILRAASVFGCQHIKIEMPVAPILIAVGIGRNRYQVPS